MGHILNTLVLGIGAAALGLMISSDNRPQRSADGGGAPHIGLEHLRNGDGAVGLAVRFDHASPHPGHGQTGPVQGVDDPSALLSVGRYRTLARRAW
ncbi:MAG: hypothetical protein CM1200mP26_17220 [Acidimicrobiales bacterium]|nr:MAG: hypothetical protein CM1200mP26_17220 [Acidimicrobiales bacterium]